MPRGKQGYPYAPKPMYLPNQEQWRATESKVLPFKGEHLRPLGWLKPRDLSLCAWLGLRAVEFPLKQNKEIR